MRCNFYRWKISGAIDSGKPMPGAARRHLLTCASCREFAAAAEETGRRLSREARDLVVCLDATLAERIKASLEQPATSSVSDQRPDERLRPGFRLSPILAAAAALFVAVAGALYLVRSRPQPMSGSAPAFQIEQPGAYLVAAVESANAPYDKEIRLWKEAFDGAANTLRGAFDIGLGEQERN